MTANTVYPVRFTHSSSVPPSAISLAAVASFSAAASCACSCAPWALHPGSSAGRWSWSSGETLAACGGRSPSAGGEYAARQAAPGACEERAVTGAAFDCPGAGAARLREGRRRRSMVPAGFAREGARGRFC